MLGVLNFRHDNHDLSAVLAQVYIQNTRYLGRLQGKQVLRQATDPQGAPPRAPGDSRQLCVIPT